MVKKIINVGVEGNDASGDPIREAFIKTNENFNELYSAFGKGDGISITALTEGPDEVTPESILISNADGDKYLSKTLVGQGIDIINTNPTEIIFSVESSKLISDNSPTLANNLDASGFGIFRLDDPDQTVANQNNVNINSFAINKGYADTHYVNIAGDTMTGFLNVPAGAEGTQVPRAEETLLRAGGFNSQMTGPLILQRSVLDTDDPLSAAPKEYVDLTNYSSKIDLFVSTNGDDNQFDVGSLRKGRSWAYSFKTLAAAIRYAQILIDESPWTTGPYVQTLTYGNGETESTVDNIEETDPVNGFYLLTITNDGTQTDARDGNQIRPGMIIKGKISNAIVQIKELGDLLGGSEEYTVVYLTDTTLISGEAMYFGDPVKDLNITVKVESGNYYEHYPIRVPPNVSIVGDELRRVIIRPRPGRSASNSTDFYFRRDTTFDTDLHPTTQTYGYHYLTDPSTSLYSKSVSSPGGLSNASYIIQQNKTYIQEEILAYVNVEWDGLDYDEAKCRRDTGYIIDALCYDMAFGANIQSIKMAEAYYRGTQAALVLGPEKTATLSSLDDLKNTLLSQVSDSISIQNITDNINTIKSIIDGGLSNVPLFKWPAPSSIDAGYLLARNIIYNNRKFFQAEIVAYIESQIAANAENISSIWYRLEYNSDSCLRDIGLIIDAIVYDLTYSGNKLTVQAAQAYYFANSSIIASGEIAPTLDAYNLLKTYVYKIAKGEQITPYQTAELRVGGSPASTAAANAASALIEIIRYTLTNDGSSPSVVNPPLSSVTTTLVNNFTNIQSQKTGTIDSNIQYISNNFFLYNSTLCRRDVGLIVNALSYDLVYGGYYRTLEAANAFFEGASALLVIQDPTLDPSDPYYNANGQLEKTLAAISYISTIAQKIVLKQPTTLHYQNTYPSSARIQQVTSMDEVAETGAVTTVANLMTFMYDILNRDSSVNPPKRNEDVDVFLLNDANILSQISCQGHGGFMCVLDPLGQILTKSPYIYKSSSFSRSKNEKTFAGGVFVDAFAGNVAAEIYSRVSDVEVLVQGLVREPLTPCAFWIHGKRFQVDLVSEYNSVTGTARVHINPITPDLPSYTEITDSTYLFLPSTSIEFLTPGNNSMCLSDFTQVNDLGYGVAAVNNGLIEAVSVFTYYNQVSYFADTGAQIRSVNGSSAHGNFGLVASGCNPLEVPDQITLKYDMVVGAQIYSPGVSGDDYYNEPDDLILFVENLTTDYAPCNQSEIEISFGTAPELEIYRFSINNAQIVDPVEVPRTPVGSVYRLVLASQGLGSTGFQGIPAHIPDGQRVTIRQNTSLWIQGLAKATATRPSTALVMYEYEDYVYRVIAFGNISSKTGTFQWLNLTATITSLGHGLETGDEIVANFSAGTNGNPTARFYVITKISSSQFQITTSTPATIYSEGIVDFSSSVTEGKATLRNNFRSVNFTVYYDASTLKVQPYTTQITASSSVTNHYTSTNTQNLVPNQKIMFDGTLGGVTAGTAYYVNDVFSETQFSISTSLVTVTATATTTSTNRITVNSSSSLVRMNPIIFSGTTFGGITAGTTYWITDIVDSTNITVSTTLDSRVVTATTTGTNLITCSSTADFVANNPIKFVGTTFGNIISGTTYYIKTISGNGTQFTISQAPGGVVFGLTSASGSVTAYTPTTIKTLTSASGSMTGTSTNALSSLTTASGLMYSTSDIVGSNYYTWGVAGSKKFAVRDISTFDYGRILYGLANNRPMKLGWQGRIHQVTKYIPSDINTPYATVEVDYLGGSGLIQTVAPIEGGWKNTPNLKAVLPANSPGDVTVDISTVRVSGHDMLKVGSGGYNTTNFPSTIYGPPNQQPDQAAEAIEIGKGRVFYVTTDQDGNFRVGEYFKVDQGTGTVTFSSSIAISNLDGLGFKRGVAIAEFSVDDAMFDNATDIVPVQQAIRQYIDRRLGLTHNGGVVLGTRLIPGVKSGFMSLDGQLAMKANMNMGSFKIANLASPTVGSDATNKIYVDLFLKRQGGTRIGVDSYQMSSSPNGILDMNANNIINLADPSNPQDAATKYYVDAVASAQNELREIGGVDLPNPITGITNNSMFVFNGTNFTWGAQAGDVLYTLSTNTFTSAIQPGKIYNSMVNSAAAIDQSKLNMTIATAESSAPTGTTAQKQARSGLASFDNTKFTVTDGFVTLKSNGTTLSNLQTIAPLTVIGNSNNSLTLTPDAVAFSSVVQLGGALYKSQFSSNGAVVRTGVDTYGIVTLDSENTNNAIVQRSATGGFKGSIIDASTQYNIGGNKVLGNSADATPYLEMYTPQGGLAIATRTISSTVNGTLYGSWSGSGTVSLTGNLTLGTNGVTSSTINGNWQVNGAWTLGSGSTLESTYAADIAEYYQGDKTYDVGTVVMIGGEFDITLASGQGTTKVAGVISNNAAYIMNGSCPGEKNLVALQGRVPCKVIGKIFKGDLMVVGIVPGVAMASMDPKPGSIIGKALQNYDSDHIGTIEIMIGKH